VTCAEAHEASRYNRVAGQLYLEGAPLEGLRDSAANITNKSSN